MRHPPENCTTGLSMEKRSSSAGLAVNPRPQRIFLTDASAASAPLAMRSADTVSSSSLTFSSSSTETSAFPSAIIRSNSSIFLIRSSSFLRRSAVLVSAASTSSTADLSVALASCSTRMTSQLSGTGISLAAMWRRTVVLPMPFGPRMPYLWPWVTVMDALSNRVCPGAEIVKFLHTNESPESGGSFLPPSREMENALRPPTGWSSSSSLYCAPLLCKYLSCALFSLLLSFSPFSTLARITSIFSSAVGSSDFVFVSLAALLPAASSRSRARRSSSVSCFAVNAFAWKSGMMNTRTVSTPLGGLGTFTSALSASLKDFLLISTTSFIPSTSGGLISLVSTSSQDRRKGSSSLVLLRQT
mmetsp:Transcript_8165/g.22846  ORF Transcript_8165/g.22846 Transcript_8165/m.22846 type:complete len:358 (+) Transcript_8165:3987-5060(+)